MQASSPGRRFLPPQGRCQWPNLKPPVSHTKSKPCSRAVQGLGASRVWGRACPTAASGYGQYGPRPGLLSFLPPSTWERELNTGSAHPQPSRSRQALQGLKASWKCPFQGPQRCPRPLPSLTALRAADHSDFCLPWEDLPRDLYFTAVVERLSMYLPCVGLVLKPPPTSPRPQIRRVAGSAGGRSGGETRPRQSSQRRARTAASLSSARGPGLGAICPLAAPGPQETPPQVQR